MKNLMKESTPRPTTWGLLVLLVLVAIGASISTPAPVEAVPIGSTMMVTDYFRDAAHEDHCGFRVRTCLGNILKDGCANEDPPPEHREIEITPCCNPAYC